MVGFTAMRTWLTVASILLAVAVPAWAQTPCAPAPPSSSPLVSPLPAPTGTFKVGRSARFVTGAAAPGGAAATQDLMLYVWYPAEASAGRPAAYVAGWPGARVALEAHLQRMFRDAFCAFDQGRIFSYAVDDAPVARSGGRFPVLLFAHGLGVPGFAYTSQMEELASHGYVVAAVEYAPAAAFVLFPDGRVGSMDADRWNAIGTLPWESPELQAFERADRSGGCGAARRLALPLCEIWCSCAH